jgi:hypothetical protein
LGCREREHDGEGKNQQPVAIEPSLFQVGSMNEIHGNIGFAEDAPIACQGVPQRVGRTAVLLPSNHLSQRIVKQCDLGLHRPRLEKQLLVPVDRRGDAAAFLRPLGECSV